MNFIKLIMLLTLLITGAATAEGSTQQHTREAMGWHLIDEGALIIDARTAQEYAAGHIKGAINIPFDVVVSQFEALEIRKDRNIVLYCRSGNRSGRAFKSLTAAGYTQLHNAGGLNAIMTAKPSGF